MAIRWKLLLIGALVALATQSERSSAEEPSSAVEIAAAIDRLGSDRFAIREEASQFLWQVGEPARVALEGARLSKDREVAARAKSILQNLDVGIRPDTSPEEAAMLRQYHRADEAGRQKILMRLRRQGSFDTVLRLARSEPDEAVRSRMLQGMLTDRNAIVAMLIQGRTEEIDRLMKLAAISPDHSAMYVEYLALQGNVEAKIKELINPKTYSDRLLLARLLRLDGKPAEALAILKPIPHEEAAGREYHNLRSLEAELFQATGNWAALAAIIDDDNIKFKGVDCESECERLGQSAFCHRLAGDGAGLAASVAALKELARTEPDQVWFCLEALLTNDQFKAAEEVARLANRQLGLEFLIQQCRYAEALEFAGWTDGPASATAWFGRMDREGPQKKDQPAASEYLAIKLATLLVHLGKLDEAQSLFNLVAERSREQTNVMANLVGTERRLRLPIWRQHAVTALDFAKGESREPGRFPFTMLVGDNSGIWWKLLRQQFPPDDIPATLQRLDDLAGPRWGKLPFTESQRTIVENAIGLTTADSNESQLATLTALGNFCLQRSEPKLARSCYEQCLAIRPADQLWLKLGDIAANESRWEDAARAYHNEWEQSKKPLPLFLHGVMLDRLGRSEGKKSKQLARLIPLGAQNERHNLADGLSDRGLLAEAAAEWQLVYRFGSLWEWGMGEAMKNVGNACSVEKPFESAQLWERYRATVLRTESGFVEMENYFELSSTVHRGRARGFLLEKRGPEALAEAQVAIDAQPNDMDAIISLIEKFLAAGETESAERLFADARTRQLQVLREFPDSANTSNGLAWLLVKTNHDLDEALKHASRAVELTPDNPAPIDTLALVHHKRGEHEQAVKHAGRCVELMPGEPHFQKQLTEFKKATE